MKSDSSNLDALKETITKWWNKVVTFFKEDFTLDFRQWSPTVQKVAAMIVIFIIANIVANKVYKHTNKYGSYSKISKLFIIAAFMIGAYKHVVLSLVLGGLAVIIVLNITKKKYEIDHQQVNYNIGNNGIENNTPEEQTAQQQVNNGFEKFNPEDVTSWEDDTNNYWR